MPVGSLACYTILTTQYTFLHAHIPGFLFLRLPTNLYEQRSWNHIPNLDHGRSDLLFKKSSVVCSGAILWLRSVL
jgi:hypothetical protein